MAITQLYSLEHDTALGSDNATLKLDETHFAIAYRSGNAGYGYVETYSVNESFEAVLIDSQYLSCSDSESLSIALLDSTHFIVACAGPSNDGFLTIFSFDGNYDNLTEVEVLEHDTVNGTYNSVVVINSTHIALAYRGNGDYTTIKTFSVDGSYQLTQIASLQALATGAGNSLLVLNSTHLLLTCTNTANFYIKTFSFDVNYENITEIDSETMNASAGYYSDIVAIDSTHFIVINQEHVYTISIDGSYAITKIDTLDNLVASYAQARICLLNSTNFAVAYTGADGDGFVKVFSFDGSYEISEVAGLEHEEAQCTYSAICALEVAHIVIVYCGVDDDGFLKIFSTGVSSAVNATSNLVVSEATSEFVGLSNKGSASRTLKVAEATAVFVPFSTTVSNMSNKKFGRKDRYEPFRISKRVY